MRTLVLFIVAARLLVGIWTGATHYRSVRAPARDRLAEIFWGR